MKNFIQKTLLIISAISVVSILLVTSAHAATFSTQMKLGLIKSDSPNKEVVIFNDDYSKCLSVVDLGNKSTKDLDYVACAKGASDTWTITSAGKVKNNQNGKCLSSPKGEDTLTLVHCNYIHSRDYIAHDFVILEQMVEHDVQGSQLAKIQH